MTLTSPKKASEYFATKLEFTTGPFELYNMIQQNESIKIIDVRAEEDFKDGHIPCALNLPKDKWETGHGLSSDKINVICCYSEVCHLAAQAAREFALKGYSVMELEGGYEEWTHHNLPIEV